MTFGSLFAGIGGIDLGLERAGFEIRWQCEIDEFAASVLARHWPDVPRYRDVRQVGNCIAMEADHLADTSRQRSGGISRELGSPLGADGCQGAGSSAFAVCGGCSRYHLQRVDLIAGGFPCQDISVAGKGVGLDGERSGLWFEYLRIVQELRPTWVLAENVPALRTRGADTVLDGLAAAGYSCWPLVVGARHVGAPHRRDRVWIVAHASRDESERRRGSEDVADCDGIGRDGQWGGWLREGQRIDGQEAVGGRDVDGCHRWPSRPGTAQYDWEEPRTVESPLGGAAYGLSERLAGRHRRNALKALGNSVVPQVVEAIGRAILEAA